MANIKSAKKRIEVSAKREDKNKAIKSAVKTAVKKVDAAIAAGNKEDAKKTLHDASVALYDAHAKGVLHKNNAARKVSRLSKAVASM